MSSVLATDESGFLFEVDLEQMIAMSELSVDGRWHLLGVFTPRRPGDGDLFFKMVQAKAGPPVEHPTRRTTHLAFLRPEMGPPWLDVEGFYDLSIPDVERMAVKELRDIAPAVLRAVWLPQRLPRGPRLSTPEYADIAVLNDKDGRKPSQAWYLDESGRLRNNPELTDAVILMLYRDYPTALSGFGNVPALTSEEVRRGGREHLVSFVPPMDLEKLTTDATDQLLAVPRSVTTPLSRLVLLDELASELMPVLYDEMIEAASEFRASGGTWREIGEQLGITPQAARQRFDRVGREKHAERSRVHDLRRRGKLTEPGT